MTHLYCQVQRLSESWGNDSWDDGEELVSHSDATDSEVDPEMEDEGGESGEESLDGGVGVKEELSSQWREGGEKPRKKSGLYQPPTHEELQTLKETQNLFKSNLMRLQVSDLPPNSLTNFTFSLHPPPLLPLPLPSLPPPPSLPPSPSLPLLPSSLLPPLLTAYLSSS